MRALVLGANGMLGRAMFRRLSADPTLETLGVVRSLSTAATLEGLRASARATLVEMPSILDDTRLSEHLHAFSPTAIINCIGWRGQPKTDADAAAMTEVNSDWPHRLARMAEGVGARLIHISSDGVFSGRRGQYRETDTPDPTDPYGRSKLLGEPAGARCTVVRTSLIGHAYPDSSQLVDWLLRQTGSVTGFQRSIFSGMPVTEAARIVHGILLRRPDIVGIVHLAAPPISKFDLLTRIAALYGLDLEVRPAQEPVLDRSLDASRFASLCGYATPGWPRLLEDMKRER
jgi:dTDP-4-dehydrorhamnose reductase